MMAVAISGRANHGAAKLEKSGNELIERCASQVPTRLAMIAAGHGADRSCRNDAQTEIGFAVEPSYRRSVSIFFR